VGKEVKKTKDNGGENKTDADIAKVMKPESKARISNDNNGKEAEIREFWPKDGNGPGDKSGNGSMQGGERVVKGDVGGYTQNLRIFNKRSFYLRNYFNDF